MIPLLLLAGLALGLVIRDLWWFAIAPAGAVVWLLLMLMVGHDPADAAVHWVLLAGFLNTLAGAMVGRIAAWARESWDRRRERNNIARL